MNDVIFWFLTVYLIGMALVPVAFVALPNLVDRGFGIARPIGLLVIGSLVWILSLFKLLPNADWTWWMFAILVGVAGWSWVLIRRRAEFTRFLRIRWLQLVLIEVVFLVFFCVFTVLKAMDPDVSHTEQPMDLTMLNAVTSAQHAPPNDLWLSGFPIPYYYFGYWMFGGIAQMSSVEPSVAYNLALATIAALAAAAVFSLVSNLVRRDGATTTQMVAGGLAAAVLLLVVSNLNGIWELSSLAGVGSEGFYEWLGIKGIDLTDPGTGWRPEGRWWWWASSRVINRFNPDGAELDFTIQEFPYFSTMLGDLHPHLMSIPFVLTMIALVANLLFSRVRWGFGWFKKNPLTTVLMVLAVGSTGFINTWDMLWMLLAMGAVVYFKSYRENGRTHLAAMRVGLAPFLLLAVVGAAFFSNYYFVTAQSQIQFPPLIPTKYATRPIHFFTVWGGLIAVLAAFASAMVVPAFSREWAIVKRGGLSPTLPKNVTEKLPWLMSISFVVFLYLAWTVTHYTFNDNAGGFDLFARLPLTALVGATFVILFVTTYRRGVRGADDGVQIALLLLTISAFLLYWAELFRLHDMFGGRHNTVFKFYYEVWIFFAVVGGYGIYFWMRRHPSLAGRMRYVSAFGVFVAALLIAVSLYYPFAATAGKSSESGTEFTLNGLAFLEKSSPETSEAFEWIRENVRNKDVLVEAPGTGYSNHGRFSGFTGRPAILGWTGHQSQWRGGDEWWIERDEDIERIYNSGDDAETLALLDRYGAEFVVVSPNEREKYTELDDSKFDRIGRRAFENTQVIIFALGE